MSSGSNSETYKKMWSNEEVLETLNEFPFFNSMNSEQKDQFLEEALTWSKEADYDQPSVGAMFNPFRFYINRLNFDAETGIITHVFADLEEKQGAMDPSMENWKSWIYYPFTMECADFPLCKRGRWEFFYEFPDDSEEIKRGWKKLVQLKKEGALPFVKELAATTNVRGTVRASLSHPKRHMIACTCGPYDDESFVIACGKRLADLLEYKNYFGSVQYKADFQSIIGSTGTGNVWNTFYEISVPFKGNEFQVSKSRENTEKYVLGRNQYLVKLSDEERKKLFDLSWTSFRNNRKEVPAIGKLFVPKLHDPKKVVYDSLDTGRVISVFENWKAKAESVKPSEELGQEWIIYVDELTAKLNEGYMTGEWILQFPVHELDDMWERAKELYKMRRLDGIVALKCETVKYRRLNQDASEIGCIKFLCGPFENREIIEKYGNNLVLQLDYWQDSSIEYFARGGNVGDVLIKLDLPKRFLSLEITKSYSCDEESCGMWQMVFAVDLIDEMWEKAKNLYKDRKLTGVRSLKCIPDLYRRGMKNEKWEGVILFCCGPIDDEELIKRTGRLVIEFMDYRSPKRCIYFRKFHNSVHNAVGLYSLPVLPL